MKADPGQTLEGLFNLFRHARIFDLEHPRRMHDPIFPAHWPGYVYALHRRHEEGLENRTSASGLIVMAEHSGTHLDALCHQAEGMKLHGDLAVTGQTQTPAGFTKLGIDTVEPIFRRGVLLDVAAYRNELLPSKSLISATTLAETMQHERVTMNPGDVALVRTGYGALWADEPRYTAAPGMTRDASEWLAEHRPFAVGSDNMAWDLPGYVDGVTGSTLPGHSILLVRYGIHIVENLNLEVLAKEQIHEFLFVAVPLKFQGGTGSPVRPLAISIA